MKNIQKLLAFNNASCRGPKRVRPHDETGIGGGTLSNIGLHDALYRTSCQTLFSTTPKLKLPVKNIFVSPRRIVKDFVRIALYAAR
jgi:hypothetical protein